MRSSEYVSKQESADPATAGIRRVRGYSCFYGYLFKYLLLCHLHLLRGESQGGWGRPNLPLNPLRTLALQPSPLATEPPGFLLERSGVLHVDSLENLRFQELPARL